MTKRPLRILVVDDSQDSADTVALLLEAKGYEAFAAYDAQEALVAMEREQINVAILDLQLPGMSGDELAVELRRRIRYPLLIIALTGHMLEDDEAHEARGFDHHLLKPLNVDQLVELLETFAAD